MRPPRRRVRCLPPRRQDDFVRLGYLLTGDRMSGEDLARSRWRSSTSSGTRSGRPRPTDAWVRKVMVNEHTSWWRRRRRRENLDPDPVRESERRGAVDTTPIDRDLWAQVMALPPRQRRGRARYYEDLTEAQTAETLGCSVGTVKSQVHRALATLRTRLEEVPA